MNSISKIFVDFAELFPLVPMFFVVANSASADAGAINVDPSATAAAPSPAPPGER